MNLLKRLIYYFKVLFTVRKINKALNIKLYKWQIDFIFYDKPYSAEIENTRQTGKSLARSLKLLFSSVPFLDIRRELLLYVNIGKNHFSNFDTQVIDLAGEDNVSYMRFNRFICDTIKIASILKDAGVKYPCEIRYKQRSYNHEDK